MWGFLKRKREVQLAGEAVLSEKEAKQLAALQSGHRPADQAELLADMLDGRLPRILGKISDIDDARLRFAAALLSLGVRRAAKVALPKSFRTERGHDRESAVRMVLFGAYHRRNIRRMQEAGIRFARVKAIRDGSGCAACAALDGAVAELGAVPELPFPACSCPEGCRCRVLAMLDEYDN